jgi:hypothetical protein
VLCLIFDVTWDVICQHYRPHRRRRARPFLYCLHRMCSYRTRRRIYHGTGIGTFSGARAQGAVLYESYILSIPRTVQYIRTSQPWIPSCTSLALPDQTVSRDALLREYPDGTARRWLYLPLSSGSRGAYSATDCTAHAKNTARRTITNHLSPPPLKFPIPSIPNPIIPPTAAAHLSPLPSRPFITWVWPGPNAVRCNVPGINHNKPKYPSTPAEL